MNIRETIQSIAENWFLCEPVFFDVLYRHQIVANEKMECPIRSGKGRVEYNPSLLKNYHQKTIEKKLGIEMIRILLKHPYERQPDGCRPEEQIAGSDMVIAPSYKIADLIQPAMYNLPDGQNYEWYVKQLIQQRPEEKEDKNADGEGTALKNDIPNNKDNGYTSLWEEDPMQMCEINEIILSSTNWGSVPGQMVEVIYQSTRGRVKYESILREFYASALSDNRRLTRSRPSRRFGFEQMGSFYKYMPKLIVALDCSGSVASENLGMYLHVLSQFFKYGIQGIDVITFDTIVNKEVTKLKKTKDKQIAIKGRGGTDFQPVVDYFCKHIDYDGMMIVTDGYAPVPQVPSFLKNKLLWIIDNKQCFESSRHRFSKTGRVCRIEI